MPRRTLKVLKACWTGLAWLLFLTGVIGCDGVGRAAPTADGATNAAAGATGTAADVTDAAHEAAPEVASEPRPVFESFQEVFSVINLMTFQSTYSTVLSIHFSGDVNAPPVIGRATSAEIVAFAEIATSPAIITAFQSTAQCPGIGDGGDDISLTLANSATYKRSATCPDLAPVVQAARALADSIRARAADGGAGN